MQQKTPAAARLEVSDDKRGVGSLDEARWPVPGPMNCAHARQITVAHGAERKRASQQNLRVEKVTTKRPAATVRRRGLLTAVL